MPAAICEHPALCASSTVSMLLRACGAGGLRLLRFLSDDSRP